MISSNRSSSWMKNEREAYSSTASKPAPYLSTLRLPVGGSESQFCMAEPEKKERKGVIFLPPVGADKEVQEDFNSRTKTALTLLCADKTLAGVLPKVTVYVEPVLSIKDTAKELLRKLGKDAPEQVRKHLDEIVRGRLVTDSAVMAFQGDDKKTKYAIFIEASAYTKGTIFVAAALGNELHHVRMIHEGKKNLLE